MTRYSNNPTLLDDLRNAREPVLDPGGEDEAELGGERRANGRRWTLAHRLAPGDRQAVVDGYRAGATARELAGRFSISESQRQTPGTPSRVQEAWCLRRDLLDGGRLLPIRVLAPPR